MHQPLHLLAQHWLLLVPLRQQQKRQGDSDYRDNDIRNSRTWASENPQYWKQYRHENPDYVGRNRNLQQQRNQKQRSALIANEDVCSGIAVAC